MAFLQVLRGTLRPAVQASVASVATFAAMRLIDLPKETSWAVISALYVVQPSVGATLANALARLGGTLIGTAAGLAGFYLAGGSPPAIAASLVATALLLTFASGFHPGLRFGLIPAAVLILAASGGIVEMAWPRAGAIGLGAVIGTLASLLVFPKPAHRIVEGRLSHAIGRCADLVRGAVARLRGVGEADLDAINIDIRSDLEAASQVESQSLREKLRRRRRGDRTLAELHRAVAHLWHTILILTRTDEPALSAAARQRLEEPLRRLGETAGDFLDGLAATVKEGATVPDLETVLACVGRLEQAVTDTPPHEHERPADRERRFALAFAIHQMARSLRNLTRLAAPE